MSNKIKIIIPKFIVIFILLSCFLYIGYEVKEYLSEKHILEDFTSFNKSLDSNKDSDEFFEYFIMTKFLDMIK